MIRLTFQIKNCHPGTINIVVFWGSHQSPMTIPNDILVFDKVENTANLEVWEYGWEMEPMFIVTIGHFSLEQGSYTVDVQKKTVTPIHIVPSYALPVAMGLLGLGLLALIVLRGSK